MKLKWKSDYYDENEKSSPPPLRIALAEVMHCSPSPSFPLSRIQNARLFNGPAQLPPHLAFFCFLLKAHHCKRCLAKEFVETKKKKTRRVWCQINL